ncbi:hypothetical protein PVMG_05145, partial [Plasmodium vivax Mauritania I]
MYCKHVKENFRFYNEVKENFTHAYFCIYYEVLRNFKHISCNSKELNFIYNKCKYTKLCTEGNDPDDIVNIVFNIVIMLVPILAIYLILF